MKVLVTGGAGYIGSHIVRSLSRLPGCEVIVADNLHKGHSAAVPQHCLAIGDLGDRDFVEQLFQTNEFDGLIHLAADSLVGESVKDPARYYRNNLTNGLNLLEAARRHGVRHIVFSSTAAVYGEPEKTPITEDAPTRPMNPYGRSKLFFEEMLADYAAAYDLRYISLRYFNAAGADSEGDIGEDHNPETHLIPIVLRAALEQGTVEVFGTDYPTSDGTCVRDYVHVTDLAEAHISALEALRSGCTSAAYNLGGGTGVSVLEVVREAERVTGRTIRTRDAGRRPGDPAVLVAGAEKAARELHWRPRFSDLGQIIQSAWKWHQSHPGGF